MSRASTGARRRVGHRVLAVVTLMFALSGLVRIGGTAGPALAREIETMAEAPEMSPKAPRGCAPDPDIAELLSALQAREKAVDQEEARLDARAQTLSLAREEVARNMAELKGAEDALSETLATAATAAETDLARLTAVYEGMDADRTAALFETMAPEFAAGFLARMQPESASAVMAGLKPETAYTISVILAGRNADVPTE